MCGQVRGFCYLVPVAADGATTPTTRKKQYVTNHRKKQS